MWDISVTGHLSAGQDSLTAATREISEEVSVSLGYSVEVRDFRFMFSYRKEEKVMMITMIDNFMISLF